MVGVVAMIVLGMGQSKATRIVSSPKGNEESKNELETVVVENKDDKSGELITGVTEKRARMKKKLEKPKLDEKTRLKMLEAAAIIVQRKWRLRKTKPERKVVDEADKGPVKSFNVAQQILIQRALKKFLDHRKRKGILMAVSPSPAQSDISDAE